MLQLTKRKPARAQVLTAPGQTSAQAARTHERTAVRKGWRRDLRANLPWILMAAPAAIWIFVFSYVPMFGLVIAFQDYKNNLGILGSKWVGLVDSPACLPPRPRERSPSTRCS